MIYIKIVLTIVLLFYICYRIGLLINSKIRTSHITDIFIFGSILIFALFQIIGQTCILLHTNFKIPLYIFVILICMLLALSYKVSGVKYTIFYIKKYMRSNLNKNIWRIILLVMVLILSIYCSYIFNENADDGFYVSLINENIDADTIYDNYEPSLGYGNDAQLRRYEISSYELFVSVLCKLSCISPTIMCHSVLPFIFIILSYCSYYLLIRNISKKDTFSIKVILVLTLIFLFEGYRWSLGIIIFSKMWQGKAIFVNFILPVIFSLLIKVYYNKHVIKDVCVLFIANIAGIFFTPVALFLITFSYLGFGILLIIKKNIKKVLYLAITGIPILIYSIIMLAITKQGGTGEYYNIYILDLFKEYIGTGKFIYLYFISCVILLFIGDKRIKFISIGIPIIYLFTIYNPLFTSIISKYLTGSAVFWRVFWLLPIEITIAYTSVKLIEKVNNKYLRLCITALIIVAIISSGNFCFKESKGFVKPENLEKIPQRIIEQTQYILSDYVGEGKPIVMCPPEPLHSVTIRQLTSDIILFWSRDFYMLDLFGSKEYNNKLELYDFYFNNEITLKKDRFLELINKYDINYVIIPEEYVNIVNYIDSIDNVTKVLISGDYIYKF